MENKKMSEEELHSLYKKGEITFVEFVQKVDPVIAKEYENYCSFHSLDSTSEEVAKKFYEEEPLKSLEEKCKEYGVDYESALETI